MSTCSICGAADGKHSAECQDIYNKTVFSGIPIAPVVEEERPIKRFPIKEAEELLELSSWACPPQVYGLLKLLVEYLKEERL